MATKKQDVPIGFGRKPMPAEAAGVFGELEQPGARQLPPLVVPRAIDDIEMFEIFKRYGLQPLLPPAKFEYQLVELIAALEDRVRALDHNL